MSPAGSWASPRLDQARRASRRSGGSSCRRLRTTKTRVLNATQMLRDRYQSVRRTELGSTMPNATSKDRKRRRLKSGAGDVVPPGLASGGDLDDRRHEAGLEEGGVGELDDDGHGQHAGPPPDCPHGDQSFEEEHQADAHPEGRPADAVGRQQRDGQEEEVGPQGDDAVAQRELLRPVHRGRAGEPVRADVLQGSSVPAQALPPEVAPAGHDLGGDPALVRGGHLGAQRLQGERELVVLGQREACRTPCPVGRGSGSPGPGPRRSGRKPRITEAVPVSTKTRSSRRATIRW